MLIRMMTKIYKGLYGLPKESEQKRYFESTWENKLEKFYDGVRIIFTAETVAAGRKICTIKTTYRWANVMGLTMC